MTHLHDLVSLMTHLHDLVPVPEADHPNLVLIQLMDGQTELLGRQSVDAAVILLYGGDEHRWRLLGACALGGVLELDGAHEEMALVVAHIVRHLLVEL